MKGEDDSFKKLVRIQELWFQTQSAVQVSDHHEGFPEAGLGYVTPLLSLKPRIANTGLTYQDQEKATSQESWAQSGTWGLMVIFT